MKVDRAYKPDFPHFSGGLQLLPKNIDNEPASRSTHPVTKESIFASLRARPEAGPVRLPSRHTRRVTLPCASAFSGRRKHRTVCTQNVESPARFSLLTVS